MSQMKVTYWILATLFALFALVQHDDPDPIPWILLYGGVAVHFIMAATNKMYRLAVWIWLGGCVVWAAMLFPDFVDWIRMGSPTIVGSMKAEAPWIELTREFLGLVVSALACAFLLWKNRAR